MEGWHSHRSMMWFLHMAQLSTTMSAFVGNGLGGEKERRGGGGERERGREGEKEREGGTDSE